MPNFFRAGCVYACLEAWASAKEFQCFKNNLQVYINGEATVKTVVNIVCYIFIYITSKNDYTCQLHIEWLQFPQCLDQVAHDLSHTDIDYHS